MNQRQEIAQLKNQIQQLIKRREELLTENRTLKIICEDYETKFEQLDVAIQLAINYAKENGHYSNEFAVLEERRSLVYSNQICQD